MLGEGETQANIRTALLPVDGVSTSILSFIPTRTKHTITMHFSTTLSLALTLACATATLDPATSNSKGKAPTTLNWYLYSIRHRHAILTAQSSATKVSKAIQAAECSHNTRTSKTQTFAVFVTDHQYDSSHG